MRTALRVLTCASLLGLGVAALADSADAGERGRVPGSATTPGSVATAVSRPIAA
jgi:hypothetical protein